MKRTNTMSTPLAQARGLGSAKAGLHHWWHQRVSAVAMVGLVCWMVGLLGCRVVVMSGGLLAGCWLDGLLAGCFAS
ncbi:MAG: hypothetical protein ACPGRU_04805 [Candidatus Puniceispirillaceae bacterium]